MGGVMSGARIGASRGQWRAGAFPGQRHVVFFHNGFGGAIVLTTGRNGVRGGVAIECCWTRETAVAESRRPSRTFLPIWIRARLGLL